MPESERFHLFLRTEFSNLNIKLNTLVTNSDINIRLLEELSTTLKEINSNLTKLVSLQSNKPCISNASSINNLIEEVKNSN